MGKLIHSGFRLPAFVLAAMILLAGCDQSAEKPKAPDIPRGYMPILDIEMNGHLLQFGPFAGYYFKPDSPDDLSRLRVLCFNEDFFYTRDMPENTLLFKGDAILTTLEPVEVPKTGDQRIIPVFFHQAPRAWLQSRPDPQNEFIHFHSCYDKSGPALTGYWLRHRAVAAFTYDMGQRVKEKSPLYHTVTPGMDKKFAKIIEFDRGPR